MRKFTKYLLSSFSLLVMMTISAPFSANAQKDVFGKVAAAVEQTVAGEEQGATIGESLERFLQSTGIACMEDAWCLVMILVACILFYLAIVKKFEPLLLLPIAFGMLLTNLPGAGMYHPEFFADGHVHWEFFEGSNA